MSKFSVILVLMFSCPFILFMMRIQELRELRGIVIKLFYHTLALLHFTFLFHIPDTSIWMGQKHTFSTAF